ncbi:hypothetical protein [Deinococcus sonorensis]|uniref:Uncharacterized protein n=2 Tax=Deinococcus sonorensis TaxID=309891 RepID=A0AAU7U9M4_9DEIO
MPDALERLLAYYRPLSTVQREVRGVPTLHTPGSPLLGVNASYLRDGDQALLPLLRAWYLGQDAPPLVASLEPLPGLEVVETLRVGRYRPHPQPEVLAVEQVSPLQLARFSTVLAEASGLPEWSGALTRSLQAALPNVPDPLLLMAYAGGEPVGALLLHSGAAMLWATLHPAADRPLMNRAAELNGGEVWTSLTDHSALELDEVGEVCFTQLDSA